jgi:hypothetical protein
MHLLEFRDIRQFHQHGIDGDGSPVIQARIGDGDAMDLGLQHFP